MTQSATGVLWPSLTGQNGDFIRKWLYGSVLIRDWDAAGTTALNNFTAFAEDGSLDPNVLLPVSEGGYGFYDIGSLTETGVEFNPKFTVDDTKIWQSRKSQRTDITEDDEEIMFSAAESTPLIDYLYYNLPIGFTGVPLFPSLGSSNYEVQQPNYTDVVYRQLVIIGVDGSVNTGGESEYIVEIRPRVSLAKKEKRQWAAKNVDVTGLTFSIHPDPASGFAAARQRGGTVWTDEGGSVTLPTSDTVAATAISGAKATLVFNQPTSPNQPFTYSVTQQVGGSGAFTASTILSATTSNGVVTITVSGLTASSTYVFKVLATAADTATATYPSTTSITATA